MYICGYIYRQVCMYVRTMTIQYTSPTHHQSRFSRAIKPKKKELNLQTSQKQAPPLLCTHPQTHATTLCTTLHTFYLSSQHDGNPAAAHHPLPGTPSCNPSLPPDRTRDAWCEHLITFRRREWTARWTVGSSRILVSGDKGEGRWEDGREAGWGIPGVRESLGGRPCVWVCVSYVWGR